MAKDLIKPLTFKHLKPTDSEQTIKDGANLYVRVRSLSDGGAISFRYYYRFEGKQKWLTLVAETLADARAERDQCKELITQGKDPSLERKLNLERTRQAQIAEDAENARLAALTNVNSLFNLWITISISDRKDLPEVKRMFEKDVLPIIGALNVTDTRKGHISEVINNLKLRNAKHTARNLLKLIRQMFRFAVDQDLIEFDPTAGLNLVKTTTKPTERDRVLSESEIRALSRQIENACLMPSTEAAIWIMLSTCCRVGELSKAEWQHINFDSHTWNIPANNSKNGKQHTIYLSDFALKQFSKIKTFCQSNKWLLPNRDNSNYVCDKSLSKQIDSRQNPNVYAGRSQNNSALVLSGGKWTPHDLRRSGATLMGDLGVNPDVIEKCLNHTEENKMKRIYQRQELKAEQAEAWRLLGDRLELLCNGADNVIAINKRA